MKQFSNMYTLIKTTPKKHASMLRSVVTMLMVIALFVAVQPGSAANATENPEKPKSETVYAILGNDGAYEGATVVNCFTQGGEIVDYGTYTTIENLMGPDSPARQGDMITWPDAATQGASSFYYQGETQKSLPFAISITYYLNGRKTDPKDIAGKTGELKIEFTIVNNTGVGDMDEVVDREIYTPFAVQVSLSLDNDAFTMIELPENATAILAGSSYMVSYSSFPLPEETFSLTMFGQNIELKPINVVALPKSPPGLDSYGDFVDVDGMTEGADDMIDGADDMQQGTSELLDALYEMKDGVKKLQTGIDDIDRGAKSLEQGTDEIYANTRTLKASISTFYSGMAEFAASFVLFDQGMELLNTNVSEMAVSLAALNDATALLDSGVANMGGGLEGVSLSNEQLMILAGNLVTANPQEGMITLATGLQAQQEAAAALVGASADLKALSGSVNTGTQDFYTEFSTTFCTSILELRTSSGALYASCLELLDGASSMDTACLALSGAMQNLSHGANGLCEATAKAASVELTNAIDEMIEGVEELEDGVGELNDDGLKELKNTLEGLDGYLLTLSEKASEYGSFMDERNAKTSTVQFVLKTEGILIETE